MKFILCMRLVQAGPDKEGMEALDWLRYHGLPDAMKIPPAGGCCGANDVEIEVGEPFARLHFGQAETWLVEVWPDDCAAGDLVMGGYLGEGCPGAGDVIRLRPDLSPDRALQLFQASQVRHRLVATELRLAEWKAFYGRSRPQGVPTLRFLARQKEGAAS